MRTLAPRLLPAAACLWVVLLLIAPAALSRGALSIGTLATYGAGSMLCHQKAERSFTIEAAQMPVCARCFGLYLAGAAGALAALLSRPRSFGSWGHLDRFALALAAAPMLLSVGLEWFGLIESSNVSRFVSALPLGLAGGWLIQQTIARDASRSTGVDALSFPRP